MTARTPSEAEIIRTYVDARLADVHTVMPGRIESFDAAKQKADVSPMLRRVQQADDGEIVENIPVIPAVPVVFPRAGGYKITFPVKRGDRCTLLFAEQSIDNYQLGGGGENVGPPASYAAADPESFQRFDLSDPVAILGWYPDTETMGAVDADDMVLGKDGGAVIHVGDDEVNLYEKAAADFVALAAKTKTELDNLDTFWSAFLAIINGPPISEPGNGSPSALQTALALAIAPIPYPTPGSVAAEKVKAT